MDVDRAYNQVRRELAEIGLLAPGLYLDHIEVCISSAPSVGEAGYLFEDLSVRTLRGYRPGVIYLPSDLPYERSVPGGTLLDTLRHEFAHAWYFTDPQFFREAWFSKAFGAAYNNCNPKPKNAWRRQLRRNASYQKARQRCRSESGKNRLWESTYRNYFITDYASTCACEDFAETFMYYLKYRHSLGRFERRGQVFRKLRAVERAAGRASRRLHTVPMDRWTVRWA